MFEERIEPSRGLPRQPEKPVVVAAVVAAFLLDRRGSAVMKRTVLQRPVLLMHDRAEFGEFGAILRAGMRILGDEKPDIGPILSLGSAGMCSRSSSR